MRSLLKLALLFALCIGVYTLYANWSAGNSFTKESLGNQLGITLGIVKVEGNKISQGAQVESGRVLGVMTKRMVTEPIWQAITGTITDEVRAVPYNICKPVVSNYEQ